MDKVINESVVEVDYTLTNKDGTFIESTKDSDSLIYIHGKKEILIGLEEALVDKKLGDKFNAIIPPEKAYGLLNKDLIQSVPREQFGEDSKNLQIGMQFEVQNKDGKVLIVTVAEINKDEILLNGNHPLTKQTLNFDVEVISLREATKNELEKNIKKPSSNAYGYC